MFFKHNLYGLLWAAFILLLCAIPGRDIPHVSFLELLSFDKFVHASVFLVLVVLLIKGFKQQLVFRFLHTHPMLCAVLLSVAYGILLEILQGMVFIERTADVLDAIANTIGCILAVLLYPRLQQYFKLP